MDGAGAIRAFNHDVAFCIDGMIDPSTGDLLHGVAEAVGRRKPLGIAPSRMRAVAITPPVSHTTNTCLSCRRRATCTVTYS